MTYRPTAAPTAIAVGYESVIREKELAFDAQLSATEIVRRCERRIGQLVQEGQARGEIRKRGQRVDRLPQELLESPGDLTGLAKAQLSDAYAQIAGGALCE